MFCESKNSTLLRFYKFKTNKRKQKHEEQLFEGYSKLIYNADVFKKKDFLKKILPKECMQNKQKSTY